jgi:hypothetical protein
MNNILMVCYKSAMRQPRDKVMPDARERFVRGHNPMHETRPRQGQSLQDKVAMYRFRKSIAVRRPVGHHRTMRSLNK